jgi:hypothetical protein
MNNMTLRKIGTKHFEGVVDITDPCYSKDVWCRMTAKVKAGEYGCCVWLESVTCDGYLGKKYTETRVGVIGIYLDGVVPKQNSMELIGEIGVDAGLAGFFMNKPDYNDDEWEDFCDSIYGSMNDASAWIKNEGFFSSSGYGDGYYPVYAHKKDNEIVALEIRFM